MSAGQHTSRPAYPGGINSRKVGPVGRQRFAGLTAPVFARALSALLSFSLAIRARSEQSSRNGSVVRRAVQPAAFIYRNGFASFFSLGRSAFRPLSVYTAQGSGR